MIREAGDSALLLRLESSAAPELEWRVTARAIAIAADVRRRAIPGVRDVVSTFRSIAVFFDPLATDVEAVAAALHAAERESASDESTTHVVSGFSRTVEVPVSYGGDAGPDLADVAAFAGCTPDEVIERHSSRTYRVFMLGFLPGFTYMGTVEDRIAAPRRATPRLRVPAGSVGIAGRQTGIYPRESPGGWQIIGRTPLAIFNASRTPPALFAPGDEVRFVPVRGPQGSAPHVIGSAPHASVGAGFSRLDAASRFVTVLRPGVFTTVQDSGRWGYQDRGVPVAGPMDPVSHRLANALVGNPRDAATLEATLLGPELRFEQTTTIAIAGADLRASVNERDVPMQTPHRCSGGSVLRFGTRRAGARAYVAFDGGVATEPVLGSRATHVLSELGGIDGRALKAGDRIPLGPAQARGDLKVGPYMKKSPGPEGGARLRVLPGPQADMFAPAAWETLQRARFTISPASDRMGYRLTSATSLTRAAAGDAAGGMVSDVTVAGALQVPPSGDPILLMADRQTTGGYPQLAVVITADLPLAAQLAPGDWIEFAPCTRAEAIAALIAQEGKLLALR